MVCFSNAVTSTVNVLSRRKSNCFCEKPKQLLLRLTQMILQYQRIKNCPFRDLRSGHLSKDCKSRNCSVPNCTRQHNKLFYINLSKKQVTTGASGATTAVATSITQGGLPEVRIKLVNGHHSLSVLAMCVTEF